VPRKLRSSAAVPDKARAAHDAVVAVTDRFCKERLNNEYAELCRRIVDTLARKRPSPLASGKPQGWAAGVVRAAGRVNFLDDPSQTPHLKMSEIDQAMGVSLATAQAKSKAVRDLIDMGPLDPEWTLPSRVADNPLAWMITVNGLVLDARDAPRPVQEEAFRKGIIPYLPGASNAGAVDEPAPPTDDVYQFKITLLDTAPPIWRRIRVKDCTLDEMHDHIQAAMGWTNSHLHQFIVGHTYYGDPEMMGDDMENEDSTATNLSDLVPKEGKKKFRFVYEYDFGDSWRHEVTFEGRRPAEEAEQCPECVEGARACPPEDCGGPWGYEDFVAAITDPGHEQHEELTEWLGGPFDPEAFDPKAATRRMKHGLPSHE
jgi:hypothetical protein